MTLFAEQVPENHRKPAILQVQPDRGRSLHECIVQLVIGRSRCSDSRKVALHIRHEDRHSCGRKSLGQDLQGDRLPGSRRPRNQPVTVAISQKKMLRHAIARPTATDENPIHCPCVRHHSPHALFP